MNSIACIYLFDDKLLHLIQTIEHTFLNLMQLILSRFQLEYYNKRIALALKQISLCQT